MSEHSLSIPDRMFAIRQKEAGGPLSYEEIDVPRPLRGEVLVKMDSAPINPSDLALIKGGYLERKYPFTPGLEGSGKVILSGGGILPSLRVGSRVACSPNPGADGTWAEYMITSAMQLVPLPKSVSLEMGSMMLVNPMTTMAFVHLARKEKHRAIVNNAAASSLGKMLNRMCQLHKIPIINIVRRESQAKELKALGATYVLNSSNSSFESELKELAEQTEATLFLDAITGSQTSLLLRAAPAGSKVMVYARLSGEACQADPAELIREDKQIVGFQLGNWLKKQNMLFKLRFLSKVKKHLDKELSSDIRHKLPLSKVEEALADYQEKMSEGKIILKP
jgi:NADPH:quinone reductase-like Zn-dependent oxidoreductase